MPNSILIQSGVTCCGLLRNYRSCTEKNFSAAEFILLWAFNWFSDPNFKTLLFHPAWFSWLFKFPLPSNDFRPYPCARNGLFKGCTKNYPNGRFCVANHRSKTVSEKI